jgi:hypothetical protein
MAEREVEPSNSLNDRAVAHPSTGCRSNNNGEERKTTCKKVTRENPCRQPILAGEDLAVGPAYLRTARTNSAQ